MTSNVVFSVRYRLTCDHNNSAGRAERSRVERTTQVRGLWSGRKRKSGGRNGAGGWEEPAFDGDALMVTTGGYWSRRISSLPICSQPHPVSVASAAVSSSTVYTPPWFVYRCLATVSAQPAIHISARRATRTMETASDRLTRRISFVTAAVYNRRYNRTQYHNSHHAIITVQDTCYLDNKINKM